jgi:hypothetical protein
MLPTLLPDAVCIFFDLQDNPCDSPAGFFKALAKCAQEQARRDRRLDLPPLPEGTPFEAGSQWLNQLDTLAGDRRILICIDEFERLETSFPGDRTDLLKLMGLFRATIQHRRQVRLLVSGVATFDELDNVWSDHFINVREVRVGHLDEPTALELLSCPIPEFPKEAISQPIAAEIVNRTGGLPYLLQMYGSVMVQHLNDQKRKQADLTDLDPVEDTVLTEANYYFSHVATDAATVISKAVLQKLAGGDTLELTRLQRRWLTRRCLITEEGKLAIPVLGRWIREEWGE